MPKFSKQSLRRLETCHPLLRELFGEVILSVDCAILEGHRDKARQDRLVALGRSKTPWPQSKHNSAPSLAVDAAPWLPEPPHLIWPDPRKQSPEAYARTLGQWYLFAGYVRRAAEELGIALRCGADWDGDWQVSDQRFHDLPHFELLQPDRVAMPRKGN